MKASAILFFLATALLMGICIIGNEGCAQIGAPTGGPRDSIPPRLVSASPKPGSTGFTGNKIVLNFNEYVNLEEVQANVLVSPLPKTNPQIDFKLKTVTVKLKDSLIPNTTYAINFGDAIRDNNENNPLKNFTYVFSTGNHIDSLRFSGKVIMAETGKSDSTLIAMLYRNTVDSAVKKTKPDYIAKLNGTGGFTFINLSPGIYAVYALKDGDGGKTYNSKAELFAFADQNITVTDNSPQIVLYAYAEEKENKNLPIVSVKLSGTDKKLRYSLSIAAQNQDLEDDLEINFMRPLKNYDSNKIRLTDTNYAAIPSARLRLDSTHKTILLSAAWKEATAYRLIVGLVAAADSAGNSIAKTDTIKFYSKKEEDYGTLVLRFSNIDLNKNPVLQFVSGELLKASYPLTAMEWKKKLFKPGEYELRILYDENKNGKWDPGSFTKKRQPEKVIPLTQKINIKANWDNERDIKL